LVENVLDGFTGGRMSDGWGSSRHYPRRWRCWAHLIRKARGLAQRGNREAHAFGPLVLDTLEARRAAVYAAREGPPSLSICPPNTCRWWPRCAPPASGTKAAFITKPMP
jgi:hypothetical protein